MRNFNIYDKISLNAYQNEECLKQSYRKSKHIFLPSNFFFPQKSCRLLYNVKNMVEPERPQVTI
jgi:hypothetical protein